MTVPSVRVRDLRGDAFRRKKLNHGGHGHKTEDTAQRDADYSLIGLETDALSRATARSAAWTTIASPSFVSGSTMGSAAGSPARPRMSAISARVRGSGSLACRAKAD